MKFLCTASFIIAFFHRCIGTDVVCGEELNGTGFTDYDDLVHLNQTDLNFLPDRTIMFTRWLFPNTLIFSCSGLLGGWIVRAESRNVSTISNLPILAVFYFSGISPDSMFNQYILRSNSDQVPIVTSTSSEGVYQYTLQQPVQVEVGDVVGVQYQEFPTEDSFQLAFLDNNNTLNNSNQLSYRYQIPADRVYMIPRDSSTQELGLSIITGYIPVVTPIMYSPSTSAEVFTAASSTPTTVEGPAGSTSTTVAPTSFSITESMLAYTTITSSVSVEETSTGARPTDSLAIEIGVGVAVGCVGTIITVAILLVIVEKIKKTKKHGIITYANKIEYSRNNHHPNLKETENTATQESSTEVTPDHNVTTDDTLYSSIKIPKTEYEYITDATRTPGDSITTIANEAYLPSAMELIPTEANEAYISNTTDHIYDECDANQADVIIKTHTNVAYRCNKRKEI